MATPMPTLNKSITLQDVLADMAGDFKNFVANLTMTPDEKAERIVKKALDRALAARESARQMRTRLILIKNREDTIVTPLESFEDQEAKLIELGGKLTADKKKLAKDPLENAEKLAALDAQIGQVAQSLKTLRENPAYQTLQESYETASDAYKTALDTANRAETNWKVLKDNLPMLVQAFQVYQEAKKAREQARRGAEEQFDPNTFMNGVAADVNQAKAELRADEDVDRDLDASKPVDPVADMLAQYDAANADAGILAEFEQAAKKK
jgi:chromosome segregation ATPase